MADIELVIKIPEDRYKEIVSGIFDADGYFKTNLTLAFRNGTLLPEGHGRLIDEDELKKVIQENDVLNMRGFNVRICDINNTSTIIEADKEQTE